MFRRTVKLTVPHYHQNAHCSSECVFSLSVKDSFTPYKVDNTHKKKLIKYKLKYCVDFLLTGILFPKEAETFLYHVKTIRPIHHVPGTVSLGIKWPG